MVIVGLQGCGKSTLTKKMIAKSNGSYQSVSQDQLKSIGKCLSTAESFLKVRFIIIVISYRILSNPVNLLNIYFRVKKVSL